VRATLGGVRVPLTTRGAVFDPVSGTASDRAYLGEISRGA
jgi:hypothetical protein